MAGAVYLVKSKCHFSWQAQYVVKFKCHFSWQAQNFVKFGMIVGAFHYKMLVVSAKSNLGCEAGCGLTGSWIILGTVSDWPRIVNDVSSAFTKFLSHVRQSFFVGSAKYLVRLDNDTCCSAHCK